MEGEVMCAHAVQGSEGVNDSLYGYSRPVCRSRLCNTKDCLALRAAHSFVLVQGILLQIFTKAVGDRPTLFWESIQWMGCEYTVTR